MRACATHSFQVLSKHPQKGKTSFSDCYVAVEYRMVSFDIADSEYEAKEENECR